MADSARDDRSGAELRELEERIRALGGVLVALSGGVDSTLLLAAAVRSGVPVLAATAVTGLQPSAELEAARAAARVLGARHRELAIEVLSLPAVRMNPPDRCYHCKRRILEELTALAARERLVPIDGSNADDCRAHRPGRRALQELGVRSPLAEAGLTKAAIRRISRLLALETADRPSDACLATRVPYGEELSRDRLRRIERAEELLRLHVAGPVRVRDHGLLARVEVEAAAVELLGALPLREAVVAALRAEGWRYVTLDLEGYRSGAMDEPTEVGSR
jgi:uncharacterized protein